MPKPQPIGRGKVLDPRHNAPTPGGRPSVGPGNRPINQQPLRDHRGREIAPNGNHVTTINNNTYITNIRNVNNHWDRHDRGYGWYHWGDDDVCHHWDGRYHWWGWYVGPVYFWTVYWNDYYWWYDPYWHRYCYYRHDRWWWQNGTVVYVYQDGDYYQYNDSDGGVVLNPDPTPPVDPAPGDNTPADPNLKTFYSADGARLVQVSGENRDAYLYDTAQTPAFEPKYLASQVTDVRFKLDSNQQLQNVLLLQDNSSFSLFDRDGNSSTAAFEAGSGAVPEIGGDTVNSSTKVGDLSAAGSFGSLSAGSVSW